MKSLRLNHQQNGSSLIEVLVTMIIIALGLLGQASLIALSSKSNNAAFARSQATLLSYDILERLRLNREIALKGDFSTNYESDSSSFTGEEIQDTELRDWKASVEQSLPSGEAEISVDGNGKATISIRWSEVVKGSVDDGSIVPTEFITESAI